MQQEQHGFQTFADALPGMVWTMSARGERHFLNRAWRAYTGINRPDWLECIHPEDRAPWQRAWQHAYDDGADFEFDYRLWHAPTQRFRWVTARAVPAHLDGQDLWIGTTIDIEERKRRELANAFLARSSFLLTASLVPSQTFAQLARAAVADFCDYAVVYVLGDDGLTRTAWMHRDPKLQPALDAMIANAPDPNDTTWIIRSVVESGDRFVRNEPGSTGFPRLASAEYFAAVELLDLRHTVVTPVRTAGRAFGALALCRCGPAAAPFDDVDLAVIDELTTRAATALSHADLFEREHRVAVSFQNAALPSIISDRRGVSVSAHYVPARSEARVGGDWYDCELLEDGRMLFSIGDVSGSGLDAAVLMATVRNAIRSVAHVQADPGMILDAVDSVVRGEHSERFVTAFVGVLDPIVPALWFCNAGHLPPLLRRPDGSIVEVRGTQRLPLGVWEDETYTTESMRIDPEAVIVCFTDGLIEGAGAFLPGEHELQKAMRSDAFARVPSAEQLYERMLPDGSRDDVAVMTLALQRSELRGAIVELHRTIETSEDASRVREEIVANLKHLGFAGESLEDARLAIGEIVANVARYAPGRVTIAVDPTLLSPVVHVIDNGVGFRFSPRLPVNVYAEGGRGLYIASSLVRSLEVAPSLTGGSHVRMVLLRTPRQAPMNPR